jgi:hypothetical protein
MGHTEMVLAVAGLDEPAIAQLTGQLASGDWSGLAPSDQVAFGFARTQAKAPWAISTRDIDALVEQFGPHRALDVIWWACRCHYMTRVADGFQLPLERENVFEDTSPPKNEDPK